ncbi:DUF6493 family protein [Solirubrobacter phytolaccae]|uniref:DUF6493 family protein n=1 Tax=Solirubrobacter phytolaccae TaxID=1404360 RepID=A0A9X3NAJ4_9ACTN|nr:DUF6493 family protein [Solirubrobacter phytolaccae]MDA0183055.1 DUF6493 family protein [Solirubrobacter phytolaccae]
MSAFPDTLLDALVAADQAGVMSALRGREEAERRAAAKLLMAAPHRDFGFIERAPDGGLVAVPRTEWTNEASMREYEQGKLFYLALLGTASMEQLRRHAWALSCVDDAPAATVLLERRPRWLASWAQWILSTQTAFVKWPLVRDLVRAGAIERPDAYVPALLRMRWYHDPTPLAELLDGDPEFWERDVWELIAYRGDDASQRAADVCGWSTLIAARVRERDRLLDALLEPLADLSAYRAAWHTKLWKALKPTRAERAARADTLRALLGASAEPVVGFALDELVRSGAPIAATDLTPALAATAKKTVRTALKQLDGAPALASIALGHPDADIQAEVLDRLERGPLDDAARGELLRQLDGLAATQRPRAEALLGVALPEAHETVEVDVSGIPAAIRAALNFGGPLPDAPIPGEPVLGEPVTPIATVDALVRELQPLSARDDVLDALLRFCDRPAPTALMERYPEGMGSWLGALDRVGYAWVHRELAAPPEYHPEVPPAPAEHRAARAAAGPYLALPTHRGGWIDPRALVARLHAHATEDELARAILRLAPEGRAEALAAGGEPLPPALRCALGGEPVGGDGPAAVAARAVAGLDPFAVEVEWGPDEWESESFEVRVTPLPSAGPLRRHVEEACGEHSVYGRVPLDPNAFPGRRELACAAAIREVGWNLDDVRRGELGAVVLETLAPATEPLPPLGIRLAVLALGSFAERERLLGADLLIAGIEDGRIDRLPILDAARLKPNRLATGLGNVATAGPLPRALVRAFLDATEPRAAPLLVLFDELCAQTHTGPVAARAHLGTLTGSSKAAKAARSLLAREGNEDVESLVLAARALRAQRWMEP